MAANKKNYPKLTMVEGEVSSKAGVDPWSDLGEPLPPKRQTGTPQRNDEAVSISNDALDGGWRCQADFGTPWSDPIWSTVAQA